MIFFLKTIQGLLKLLGLDLSSRVGVAKSMPHLPNVPPIFQPKPPKAKKTIRQTEKATRELIVQVDLAKNMTTVFSQYPPSENLIMQLDALCITMARCIEEGENPEKIHQRVKFYLDTMIMRYSPGDKGQIN